MTETPTTAAERVQAGAVFLDAEFPGWAAYINRLELDVSLGSRCILGQLAAKMPAFAECRGYGSWSLYSNACAWLLPRHNGSERNVWAAQHGFQDDVDGHRHPVVITYNDLQAAWMLLLDQRHTQPPPTGPAPQSGTDKEDEEFRDRYERRLDGE